jgi:hypothetical protein
MPDDEFGKGPKATELAASDMPLLAQMHEHFLRHHFPPVPIRLADVAVKAIVAINEGKEDANISLPDKIIVRGNRQSMATAREIAQALVLGAWVCACTSCSDGNPHWGIEEKGDTNG